MKPPSFGAILIGLIPFVGMCFTVSLWDRIYPLVLGLPFNLFWLISWILLTPLCMWAAYRIDVPRNSDTHRGREGDPRR
ncbi:MAG: DUF3311 domain-containing protein [Candidatus Acidiferrales bacterium]